VGLIDGVLIVSITTRLIVLWCHPIVPSVLTLGITGDEVMGQMMAGVRTFGWQKWIVTPRTTAKAWVVYAIISSNSLLVL